MMKRATIAAGAVCGLAMFLVALPLSRAAADDSNGKNAVGSYMFKFTGVEALLGAGQLRAGPGDAPLGRDTDLGHRQ